MSIPSLPFKVLALGPFVPSGEEVMFRDPIRVDPEQPDQAIEALHLQLSIALPGNLCAWDRLAFPIRRLKDFHPDSLLEHHSSLKNLLDAKRLVHTSKAQGLPDEEVYRQLQNWPDLPFDLRPPPSRTQEHASSPVDRLLEMVAMPGEETASPAAAVPLSTQIDSFLQQVLRQIFSDPEFRKVESTHQGLHFLLRQAKSEKEVAFEILPVSFETLEEILDHLTLSKLDDLPSLVILDLPFDHSMRKLELLEKVALFSETLLVPTLCWVSPKFLFLERWEEMDKLPFLPHYIDEPAFAKWRRLRGLTSSRWIGLFCNRFLIRYPYGPDNRVRSLPFTESDPLWISPVWAAASLILLSHLQFGWPTRFTDWQSLRLTDLATHLIGNDRGIATEADFGDERIDQLIRIGIIPLASFLNRDIAFIPRETTAGGTALSWQLFLSRTSQFLLGCRDHLGSDLSPSTLEEKLREAFLRFYERSGRQFPQSLEITAKRPAPGEPIQLRIRIDPPKQILPSGERLELELRW
ncbi:MAG: type VI secretion system contractile sheath large subunit [Desulfobacterota bacterium]|nr:type VI secretion system contractile sheath large subunit [Thermodesulfobacteriota bacterium]